DGPAKPEAAQPKALNARVLRAFPDVKVDRGASPNGATSESPGRSQEAPPSSNQLQSEVESHKVEEPKAAEEPPLPASKEALEVEPAQLEAWTSAPSLQATATFQPPQSKELPPWWPKG
ncbi:unnamed protein product, partial [Effrenium voratum]